MRPSWRSEGGPPGSVPVPQPVHASGVRSPGRRCLAMTPGVEKSGSLELTRVPFCEHRSLSTISAGPPCLVSEMVADCDVLAVEAVSVPANGAVAGRGEVLDGLPNCGLCWPLSSESHVRASIRGPGSVEPWCDTSGRDTCVFPSQGALGGRGVDRRETKSE